VLAPFTVATAAGEAVAADIWFRCYGVRPQSDYLGGDLAAARRPDGFVDVDEHLRVAGQLTVFAIGDVTAVAERKGAGAAGRHAAVVAENIVALIGGATQLPATYQPGPGAAIIPLGSTGGASQVPGPEGLTVLDAATTARYKGKDLMVGRFATLFGHSEGAA
jgi:NADH dehydrogenase FAD-containing subunit